VVSGVGVSGVSLLMGYPSISYATSKPQSAACAMVHLFFLACRFFVDAPETRLYSVCVRQAVAPITSGSQRPTMGDAMKK
jgi:hypothetical protein